MKTSRARGFGLIEILIVVAIVGILTAVAYPSFRRYLFDAYRAEGIQTLLGVYRSQQQVKNVFGQYGDALESDTPCSFVKEGNCDIVLQYRVSSHAPRYNLITGDEVGAPDGKRVSFRQLGYNDTYFPESSRVYGFRRTGEAIDPYEFLIGVESAAWDREFADVLAINEKGSLFTLCDAWSRTSDPNASAYYNRITTATLECSRPDDNSIRNDPPPTAPAQNSVTNIPSMEEQ